MKSEGLTLPSSQNACSCIARQTKLTVALAVKLCQWYFKLLAYPERLEVLGPLVLVFGFTCSETRLSPPCVIGVMGIPFLLAPVVA